MIPLYAPAFRFPPVLQAMHVEELRKRGITPEFALASGVRTAADNELRALNFQAGLPLDQRRKGLQGLCFTYRDPATGAELAYRIKPDEMIIIGGERAKYLSRIGDPARVYFPHTTTAEMLADSRIPAVITEGEFKGLSIAETLFNGCSPISQ